MESVRRDYDFASAQAALKKLSHVLRRDPQSIGIILYSSGYCDVAELIEKLSSYGTEITFALIDESANR